MLALTFRIVSRVLDKSFQTLRSLVPVHIEMSDNDHYHRGIHRSPPAERYLPQREKASEKVGVRWSLGSSIAPVRCHQSKDRSKYAPRDKSDNKWSSGILISVYICAICESQKAGRSRRTSGGVVEGVCEHRQSRVEPFIRYQPGPRLRFVHGGETTEWWEGDGSINIGSNLASLWDLVTDKASPGQ